MSRSLLLRRTSVVLYYLKDDACIEGKKVKYVASGFERLREWMPL